MRNFITIIALCASVAAVAKPVQSNDAFEKMKSLAGSWEGTVLIEKSTNPVRVVYRIVSGGNAVEEEISPGTPHDMITVYFMDGKSLVLNHYCEMGNEPRMKLNSRTAGDTLDFDFDGGANIPPGAGHMHSLKLKLFAPDHIEAVWNAQMNGKPMFTVDMDLHRVKT